MSKIHYVYKKCSQVNQVIGGRVADFTVLKVFKFLHFYRDFTVFKYCIKVKLSGIMRHNH